EVGGARHTPSGGGAGGVCRDLVVFVFFSAGRVVAAALAQGAQRAFALVAARAVQDQDTVEVVDLMLQHARLETRRLDQDLLAKLVAAADARVQRAIDVNGDLRQAEAALLGGL